MRLHWATLAAFGAACLVAACGPAQPEAPSASWTHSALTAAHAADNTNARSACNGLFKDGWTGNGALVDPPIGAQRLDLTSPVHHHGYDEGSGTESGCAFSSGPFGSLTRDAVQCPSGDVYVQLYAGSTPPPGGEVSTYCTGSGATRTCDYRQRMIDNYASLGFAMWVDALDGTNATCRNAIRNVLPASYSSKSASLTQPFYFENDGDKYPSSMCCVYFGSRSVDYIAEESSGVSYPNAQSAAMSMQRTTGRKLYSILDAALATTRTGFDCEDKNAAINPGEAEDQAIQVDDGTDQNCDGKEACLQDDDDDNYPQSPLVVTAGSGVGDPYNPTLGNCLAATRLAPNKPADINGNASPTDCNDGDYTVHPNKARIATGANGNTDAVEVTGNTVDEDCDGTIRCPLDEDGDGYGSTDPLKTKTIPLPAVCGQVGSGTADDASDCNDANRDVNPATAEILGDGLDQNCDLSDRCYADNDEDGWGDPSFASSGNPVRPPGTPATTVLTCDSTALGWKWSSVADDCDDSDKAIHKNSSFDGTYRVDPTDRISDVPGDTIDQDCDARLTCFVDVDGDGFGVNGTTKVILAAGSNTCANQDVTAQVAKYGGDCNDVIANDGVNMHPNSVGGVPVAGTVRNGPLVYGTAVETPGDNLDQDCDGKDQCFADRDNDNYGVDPSTTAALVPTAAATVAGWNADGSLKVPYCRDTANASDNMLDCNDLTSSGAGMHPNTYAAIPGYPSTLVEEVAGDNIDQDCDGRDLCFVDADNDNYGAPTAASISGPTQPTGTNGQFTSSYCGAQGSVAANAGDCDDANADVNPAATEVAGDDLDQNCNGGDLCFVDADGDHYGATTAVGVSATIDFTGPINPPVGWKLDGTVYPNDRCDTKPGYATFAGDCNDTQGDPTSASVHPNTHPDATYRTSVAVEIVGDKIDQDCDSADACYADADGDNWGVSQTVTAADMPLPANPAYPAAFTLAGHEINGVPIAPNSPLLLDCVAVPAAARFPDDCDDRATPVDFAGHGPGWAFHPNTTASGFTPGSVTGFTPAVEVIADNVDHDCDGRDLCYADADDDNYGVATATTSAVVPTSTTDTRGNLAPDFCARAANASANAEDCNDLGVPVDASGHGPGWSIHPNTQTGSYYVPSVELIGDDLDQDCDLADTCYWDSDDDNYGVTLLANGSPAPTVSLATQPGTFDRLRCVGAPFAAKVANGADVDCDDRNPKAHPNTQTGAGYTASVEVVADNIDQNCDYNDDCWDDVDNDGFGTTRQITLTEGTRVNPMPFSCTEERYASATNDDCDDTNPYIFPGAPETVGDLIDEDCNLKLDCYYDGDDDGYGDPNHAVVPDAIPTLGPDGTTALTCDEPSVPHIAANKGDCDDSDPLRNPGKDTPDVPGDAVDQNCDGYLDCFTDFDNDGHGDDNHAGPAGANVVVKAVVATPAATCNQSATDHFAAAADDCYDDNNKRFPGSGLLCGSTTTPCEVCEQSGPQLDDDCDGNVNTATIPATPFVPEHTVPVTTTSGGWIAAYLDADGDGFGSNDARLYTPACEISPGTSSNNLDCDDAAAPLDADGHGPGWSIHPGVFEKCDGIDQNCNGVADEAEAIDPDPANQSNAGCLVMYRDRDRDGTGDPTVAHCVCPDPRQPAEPYVAVSDTDAGDTDWYDQSVEVSPLHGTYAGEDYVAPSTDCDDVHADVRPDECHDGLDNDGDGWVDAADDGCKVGMGTDTHGFGLRSASETNRSSTYRHDPSAVRAVVERIDGHDNDCNGEIPAIELDCDDDSSFPLLPVNPPPDTFLHAADLGLTSCTDDAAPPALRCWDQKLELTCDGFTGLWVTRYGVSPDGFGGRYKGGYREVLATTTCAAVGDCDDHCANRCPAHAETCDGVDNNCSLIQDMSIPLAESLPTALSGAPLAGTVVAAELDFDGDGHASCTDAFLNGDAEIHQAPLTCTTFPEETKLSDCDDLCFYQNTDAVEVCDGFVNVCGAAPSAREGADRDEDDHVTCGAYGPPDTLVDEDVFVPVWVDCNSDSVAGTALAAACPSPAPSPAVPPTTPGPTLVPLLAPRERAATCDAPLTDALIGLATRAGIPDAASWIEGKDSAALVRTLCAPTAQTGGLCSVVKVSLLRDEDMLEDGTGGQLDPACAESPEQASVRTVWPTTRIVEARAGVVEEECLRLFGKVCEDVEATTPRVALGAPPVVDAQLGVQATGDTDAPGSGGTTWWLEFGRFAPHTSAGAVMTCWGDPRAEAIRTQTGGDCDDTTNDASRDLAEGPNDLVLAYNGLNGDCGRCVDGIDNNCDGQTDCADPTCSVCFVGQGQGCAGTRDACGDAAAGGGCTTGSDGRNLAVLGLLPILGLVARRRARRAPDAGGV